MAGRLSRVLVAFGTTLRDMGASLPGFMPAMRSPDGTFGTQRMQSKALAAERGRKYPGS
jgi:hypothetical protein